MSLRYNAAILGAGFNPLKAPNAPTIGTAAAGVGQVSVSFTAPTDVGGSAITSYAVRVSPGDFSGTGVSSPITISGLTNGTTYTFSVSALNSYGPSLYSGTVTATPNQLFIEDVFSTFLYTGNGSTQTITNGINISGQGGLVWAKSRTAGNSHILTDTARGVANTLATNWAGAQNSLESNALSSFNSTGFSLNNSARINANGEPNVSWTFLESTNFFDIVTYTGTGSARTIAHNLGIAPGCIIVKRTDTTSDWQVYHQSTAAGMGPNKYMVLNSTAAEATGSDRWNNTAPTSTVFSVGNAPETNANGGTYVAYLFAHDTSSGGLIQCGSYAGSGAAGNTVTLGWEPQWVMIKASTATQGWWMYDNMRGMPVDANDAALAANTSNAEQSYEAMQPIATGFQLMNGNQDTNASGVSYIYIAIRRGPMKTPTVGTSVFSVTSYTGNSTNNRLIGSVTTDLAIFANPPANNYGSKFFFDRLRSANFSLDSTSSGSQTNLSIYQPYLFFDQNNAVRLGSDTAAGFTNLSGFSFVSYNFQRAPGFFDEVCYTGTGVARTVNHNLGVAPELMIVKIRSSSNDWRVYYNPNSSIYLNTNQAGGTASSVVWNNTDPTATVFSVGIDSSVNGSGGNYVAYLFASCSGVSKVGTYTGNGSSQTINCGFTTGARYVLIKRTDSTGDWYVWDSARGITSGNDPYILLNNGAAEVTGYNSVDTASTGFTVIQNVATNVNVNTATYIFLAIS